MKKIEEFVIKMPESVIETPEIVSITDKSVAESLESDSVTEEQPKKREKIDIGKIMALKNAGWKNKDIADEMRMDPQAVANAIYNFKKKQGEVSSVKMTRLSEISSERPKL